MEFNQVQLIMSFLIRTDRENIFHEVMYVTRESLHTCMLPRRACIHACYQGEYACIFVTRVSMHTGMLPGRACLHACQQGEHACIFVTMSKYSKIYVRKPQNGSFLSSLILTQAKTNKRDNRLKLQCMQTGFSSRFIRK